MKKGITLLGSTGSIGKNTLAVVDHLKDQFSVKALAAKSQIDLLEQQIIKYNPDIVAVFDKDKAMQLQKRVSCKVVAGQEGLEEVAGYEKSDIVVSALSGSVGIFPTIKAIEAKKRVALANKEVLVSAGSFVMKLAKENNVSIFPIDSEHSAIFQCLVGEDTKEVKRLVLTASGGPFYKHTSEMLGKVSLEDALAHPTWNMGSKNTVDSSTLMNKGLEVIEAHYLFDIPLEKIEVVIHPQSIIHSFVEMVDHSTLCQLSKPDMRLPIQYALCYPKRFKSLQEPFPFDKACLLEFYPPDKAKFPCLSLAYQAVKEGGSLPCFMNAANEGLVNRFLQGEISWIEIGRKLEKLMGAHKIEKELNLDLIEQITKEARKSAISI